MALALVACDDKSDLGVMQTNPQLPVVSPAETVSVVPAVPASGSLDLADYSDGLVTVATIVPGDSVPEGAVFSMEMQIASNENFSDAITLPLQTIGDRMYASVQDWDNAFRRLYGKAPAAKTNFIRTAVYMTLGSQALRVGNNDTWYCTNSLSVTPIDLGIHVEEAYYLVGTLNNWDLATAVKFEHSDKNVYDDPVFTLAIDVTADQAEGGWWWKIVPESAFQTQSWDGLFGVELDGDTSLSGNLYENGNAGQLKQAGQQLFTIDMLSCTYTVTSAVQRLYTPGQSNGWDPAASSTLTTSDFTNYDGFLYLNGEWLLTPAPNWDNKYGAGEQEGVLVANGGNLPLPADGAGLYWTVANLGSLTYNVSKINSISLIGDFNGWGGDVELTPSADFLTWTGSITFEAAGGWKLRCNNDWAINLGGDTDNLTKDGSNIDAPEPGTYTVTLDLRNHPYSIKLTK